MPSVKTEDKCKHGKWHDRHFRNQGQCVSHDRHELKHHHHGGHGDDGDHGDHGKHHG